jgi:hypothetical protein
VRSYKNLKGAPTPNLDFNLIDQKIFLRKDFNKIKERGAPFMFQVLRKSLVLSFIKILLFTQVKILISFIRFIFWFFIILVLFPGFNFFMFIYLELIQILTQKNGNK